LKAHSGGFRGRALQKNDELSLGTWLYPEKANYNGFVVLPWQADIHPAVKGLTETDPSEIWVLPGNEWDRLSSSGKDNFLMTSFLVRQQSDRMGYRLDNIPLPVLNNEELVSSAVSFGTIQLLPGGKLILLMADHQTSGGYPRIAHVITAHHSKIAQKKAGDRIHFHLTEQKIAEELLTRQQRHLQQLAFACNERLENFLKQYN
jgi:antagonist of KipI